MACYYLEQRPLVLNALHADDKGKNHSCLRGQQAQVIHLRLLYHAGDVMLSTSTGDWSVPQCGTCDQPCWLAKACEIILFLSLVTMQQQSRAMAEAIHSAVGDITWSTGTSN